jgi:hypothetical protein
MKAKKNFMYDSNYTVKDGRLINNAPRTQMGITKMANMNRAKKRAEKISMIVEANGISKMLGDM